MSNARAEDGQRLRVSGGAKTVTVPDSQTPCSESRQIGVNRVVAGWSDTANESLATSSGDVLMPNGLSADTGNFGKLRTLSARRV
jgi:hypothetical protein